MSRSHKGALAALAAIALIHSASAATPQPAPAAKKTAPAPKAAPAARPAAPAPRPVTRYTPPPPPPAPENALPQFELSAYGGFGNFKVGDDDGHVSHGSHNYGVGGWGVVAQHVLLGVDYDHTSADFGLTLGVGRVRYGVGYIGPIGQTASWYGKVFGAHHTFDCDAPCDGTDQDGFGVGGGFVFAFAQRWNANLDLAYSHLSGKDDGLTPALNIYSIGGKVQYKINRSVGLFAGLNTDYYDDAESGDNNSYITLLNARFGISVDVY